MNQLPLAQTKQSKIEVLTFEDNRVYHIVPLREYYVSVTTHLDAVSKGKGFENYLLETSPEAAEEKRDSSALSGKKIHHACYEILRGHLVDFAEFVYVDEDGNRHIGFTKTEWKKVLAFKAWIYAVHPKVYLLEHIVYSRRYKYAGTLDAIVAIQMKYIDKKAPNPEDWVLVVLDWKTGASIYYTQPLQSCAYTIAAREMKLADVRYYGIVRLGTAHKNTFEAGNLVKNGGWEMKIYDTPTAHFRQYFAAKTLWEGMNPNFIPQIEQFPKTIKIKPEIYQGESNANKTPVREKPTPPLGENPPRHKVSKRRTAKV